MGRIQGAWSKRFEADEELREETLDLARRARYGAIPKVAIAPASLRPFPWSKKKIAAVIAPIAQGDAAAPSDEVSLDRYAAISAELSLPGADRPRVLEQIESPKNYLSAAEARYEARFAADPLLAQDFRRLVGFFATRVAAMVRSGDDPVPAPVALPASAPLIASLERLGLAGTSLALDIPRGPALPFAAGARPAKESRRRRRRKSLHPRSGRAPLSVAPRSRSTSRAACASVRGPENRETSREPHRHVAHARRPARARPALRARQRVSRSGHAVSCGDSREPSKKPARGSRLKAMSLSLDIPRDVLLRAKKASPSAEPTNPPPASSPQPAAPQPAAPQPAPSQPASVRADPPPSLTLEQHASLAAELATYPAHAREILARYRLTEETKTALDGYYRDRVSASPDMREAWNRAYRAYVEWLRERR